MTQKHALGKGLSSLFPSLNPSSAAAIPSDPAPNRDRHPGISIASVDEIQVNQYQPRRDFDLRTLEELAASIRANGIIQPLIVRKDDTGAYRLIAGERRLRAARLAGLKQVPIVIRKSTDREALELALIENIQRQDLNCVDEALAYFQLLQDFALTQEEVANRVGKDRATVANYLRLLRLPETVLQDLKDGRLSFGHGKALLALEQSELILRARALVVEQSLSVRETEALAHRLKTPTGAAIPGVSVAADRPLRSSFDDHLANLSQQLTRQWSTKVQIAGTERRGKFTIEYGSRQELDRILEAMQNNRIWVERQT